MTVNVLVLLLCSYGQCVQYFTQLSFLQLIWKITVDCLPEFFPQPYLVFKSCMLLAPRQLMLSLAQICLVDKTSPFKLPSDMNLVKTAWAQKFSAFAVSVGSAGISNAIFQQLVVQTASRAQMWCKTPCNLVGTKQNSLDSEKAEMILKHFPRGCWNSKTERPKCQRKGTCPTNFHSREAFASTSD